MNQLCKVCDEPAAGYHFGAFTCEGCKSFFGRTYNNLSQVHECKNGGICVINKQNRTSCKACRLKKCLVVGMSKSGSRYGRRSNWFKIHCLLQEQAATLSKTLDGRNGAMCDNSMTNLPTDHHDHQDDHDDTKVEGSVLSSPESVNSDIDVARLDADSRVRDEMPSRDFVANLGLYSLNPGLSLLQASQFYSRFYPQMLYQGLTHPQLMMSPISPRTSPLASVSPVSCRSADNRHSSMYSPDTSPHHRPPTPPFSIFGPSSVRSLPFVTPRKREAESPLEELRHYQTSPTTDQQAPIDLRIKRRRLSAAQLRPDQTTPPRSPDFSSLHLPSIPATITPVDLTTKA